MNQGIDLHLSPDEQAFYDALAKPELIKIHYESQV
jgi:type I restriction enzyme R subunit